MLKPNTSSDEDDDNFEGQFKKIDYNGSAFDSDNNESDPNDEDSI